LDESPTKRSSSLNETTEGVMQKPTSLSNRNTRKSCIKINTDGGAFRFFGLGGDGGGVGKEKKKDD
jgi:hypothetical protein